MGDTAHGKDILKLIRKRGNIQEPAPLPVPQVPSQPELQSEPVAVEPKATAPVHHAMVRMSFREKLKFVLLRSVGNFLLLFSIYGVLATFGPALEYEVAYRVAQVRGVSYRVAEARELQPDQVAVGNTGPSFGSLLSGEKEQILIPNDTDFSILIPKIGASAKVFPNIDPDNEKDFLPVLQKGIAHAKGTVFPGFPGNTYLFAHSTDNWWSVGRYNAIFYLLKDLSPGDDVTVFFENRRYEYQVTETKIGDPSEVSYLKESHGGQEQLVMQTCWPPGTTFKRFFVFAKLKSDIKN